ncbi:MAG: hypothetical protein ACRDZY_04745 [Acidimicrobiales bacterium]
MKDTGAVRATPVPVFAGLLGLLVAVRLVARRRRSRGPRGDRPAPARRVKTPFPRWWCERCRRPR